MRIFITVVCLLSASTLHAASYTGDIFAQNLTASLSAVATSTTATQVEVDALSNSTASLNANKGGLSSNQTWTGKNNFSIVIATAASAGAGVATDVSCPSGTWALWGGCDCTGGVALSGFVNRPRPAPTAGGASATLWRCQATGTTGAACAAFVGCSTITNQ